MAVNTPFRPATRPLPRLTWLALLSYYILTYVKLLYFTTPAIFIKHHSLVSSRGYCAFAAVNEISRIQDTFYSLYVVLTE